MTWTKTVYGLPTWGQIHVDWFASRWFTSPWFWGVADGGWSKLPSTSTPWVKVA